MLLWIVLGLLALVPFFPWSKLSACSEGTFVEVWNPDGSRVLYQGRTRLGLIETMGHPASGEDRRAQGAKP